MAFKDEFEVISTSPTVTVEKIDPQEVFDYLTVKGVPEFQAKGMVANIKSESAFKPDAIGDQGTSGGLFQHHADRFESLKKSAPDWKTNWKAQVDFALSEGVTAEFLKQNFSTPEQASEWFTKKFEIPKDANTKAIQRAKDVNLAGTKLDENEFESVQIGGVRAPIKEPLPDTVFSEEALTRGKGTLPDTVFTPEALEQAEAGPEIVKDGDVDFEPIQSQGRLDPQGKIGAATERSVVEAVSKVVNFVGQFTGAGARHNVKTVDRLLEENKKIREKKNPTKRDIKLIQGNIDRIEKLGTQIGKSEKIAEDYRFIAEDMVKQLPESSKETVQEANKFFTDEGAIDRIREKPGEAVQKALTVVGSQFGPTAIALLPGGIPLLGAHEISRFDIELREFSERSGIEIDQDIIDKNSLIFGAPSGAIGAITDRLISAPGRVPFIGKKLREFTSRGLKKSASAMGGLVISSLAEVVEEITQDRVQKMVEGKALGEQLQRIVKENPVDHRIIKLKEALRTKANEIGQGERETIILTILTAGIMGAGVRAPTIAKGGLEAAIDTGDKVLSKREFKSLEEIPEVDIDQIEEKSAEELQGFDEPEQTFTTEELQSKFIKKGDAVPGGFEIKEETEKGFLITPTEETLQKHAPELLLGKKAEEHDALEGQLDDEGVSGKTDDERTGAESRLVADRKILKEEIEQLKGDLDQTTDEQEADAETDVITDPEFEPDVQTGTDRFRQQQETLRSIPEKDRTEFLEKAKIAGMREGKTEEQAQSDADNLVNNADEHSIFLIEKVLEEQKERTATAEERASRAEELAFKDQLTGLQNRTSLEEKGLVKGKDFTDGDQMIIDIDDFKSFNEKHGHDTGDDVLTAVGTLLNAHFNDIGTAYRIGGDEFYVRFNDGVTDQQKAEADASFRKSLATRDFKGDKVGVTSGVGETFKLADDQEALAKKAGKDQLFIGGKNATEIKQDIKTEEGVSGKITPETVSKPEATKTETKREVTAPVKKEIVKAPVKKTPKQVATTKKRVSIVKEALKSGEITEDQAVTQTDNIVKEIVKKEAPKESLPVNIDFATKGSIEGKSVNRILSELDEQRVGVEDAFEAKKAEIQNLSKEDRRNPDVLGKLADELNALEEKLIKDEALDPAGKGDIARVGELEGEIQDSTPYRKKDLNTIGMIAKFENALATEVGLTQDQRIKAEEAIKVMWENLAAEQQFDEKEVKKAQKDYRKKLNNPRLNNQTRQLQKDIDDIRIAGKHDQGIEQKKETTKAIEEKKMQIAKVELGFDKTTNITPTEIEELLSLDNEVFKLNQDLKTAENKETFQKAIDVKSKRMADIYGKIDDRHIEQKKKNTTNQNKKLAELYPPKSPPGNYPGEVRMHALNIGALKDLFNYKDIIDGFKNFVETKKDRAKQLIGKDFQRIIGKADRMKIASQAHIKALTMKTTEDERGVMMFAMEADISKQIAEILRLRKSNPPLAVKKAAILSNKVIPTLKEIGPKSKALKTTMRALLFNTKRLREVLGISREIKAHNDKLWKLINQNVGSMDTDQVKWYVSHIWGNKAQKNVTEEDVIEFKKFMTDNKSLKSRTFQTYREGISRGWQPRFLDIAQIMDVNTQAGIQIAANNAMIEMLKGKNEAKVSLMAPTTDATRSFGWEPLSKFGISVKALEGMSIHPDMKPVINSMFKDKRRNAFWTTFETINGILKKLNLSLALFHHLTLAETALGTQGIRKTVKALTNYKAMYKAAKNGSYDVVTKNWENALDFVEHGGQLGDITDVHRDQVDNLLSAAEEGLNKIAPKLGAGVGMVKSANRVWDRMLWDYFHNTLKIEGYNTLLDYNIGKKPGATKNELNVIKRETAQLVNDTFGGQNWKGLMTNPRSMQLAQTLLLSPDWTLSTARQFVSATGMGSITKTELGRQMRKKMGKRFWLNAFLKYFIPLNMVNAMFRIQDKDDEWKKKLEQQQKALAEAELELSETNYFSKFTNKKVAEAHMKAQREKIAESKTNLSKIEKARPDRIPKTFDDWIGLTMMGNSIGRNTQVFFGRNEDGTERYRGFGKQFKDVPEFMFLLKEPTGITFDPFGVSADRDFWEGSLIHKTLGKGSPALQLASLWTMNSSLNGFTDRKLEAARRKGFGPYLVQLGWSTGRSVLPFSWQAMANPKKDFTGLDLATSQSKGASDYSVDEGARRVIKSMMKANKGESFVDHARTLKKIEKSSERNGINFNAVLGKAYRGTFNHLKRDIKKWTGELNQLKTIDNPNRAEKADIKKLEVQLHDGYYYIKSLKNGIDATQVLLKE